MAITVIRAWSGVSRTRLSERSVSAFISSMLPAIIHLIHFTRCRGLNSFQSAKAQAGMNPLALDLDISCRNMHPTRSSSRKGSRMMGLDIVMSQEGSLRNTHRRREARRRRKRSPLSRRSTHASRDS